MSLDLNYFRQKLEAEKALLAKELDSIGVPKKDNPNDWDVVPGEREQTVDSKDEMADRMEDLEEREATEVPLETRLREIVHALKKIETGAYGRCEIGDEEIESDRLEANPAARTCKKHIAGDSELPPLR